MEYLFYFLISRPFNGNIVFNMKKKSLQTVRQTSWNHDFLKAGVCDCSSAESATVTVETAQNK